MEGHTGRYRFKYHDGGRVKRIQQYIGNEPFMLTYGDGVSNVDLNELIVFHRSHGKIATITTVNLGQSKGVLNIADDNTVFPSVKKMIMTALLSTAVLW